MVVAPPRFPGSVPPTGMIRRPGAADLGQLLPSTVRVRITDAQGTRVVTLPLEDYVLGAVRAELPPRTLQEDAVDRVLLVQALVSRTYALANLGRHAAEGFDLCDSTHCQLYRAGASSEHATDLAARAVASTRGEVITFDGRIIQALFHSNCGGHTTSASSAWGGADEPYLQGVDDEFCAHTSPGDWTFVADEPALRSALDTDARTRVGARLNRIDITGRDASGRAAFIALSGDRTPLVRAEEFRTVMCRVFGPQSIRSTQFDVSRRDGRFVFTGVGYGHGVGLCQVGATLRARAGYSAIDIITHYFPGTRLQSAALALASALQDTHAGGNP